MKPPVDAPTSRQTSPLGSIPNASSAAASLWPPRLTYGSRSTGRWPCPRVERSPALRSMPRGVAVADPDLAGEDRACARVPRLGEPALDEELVEALAGRRRAARSVMRVWAHPAYRGTAPLHRGSPVRGEIGQRGAGRAAYCGRDRAGWPVCPRPPAISAREDEYVRITVEANFRRPSRRKRTLLALVLMLALPGVVLASDVFSDVPDSSPYHDSISAIAEAGITVGCGSDSFCPDDPITREQEATFVHRAVGRVAQFYTETRHRSRWRRRQEGRRDGHDPRPRNQRSRRRARTSS